MSEPTKSLNQPGNLEYYPKQVITVFSSDAKIDNAAYYLEIADIMADGQRNYIGAGKPLTKETLAELLTVVADSDKVNLHSVSEVIPTNVLMIDQRPGKDLLAWWRPAVRQTLLIQNKANVTCWVPAMVFIVKNKRLIVAALSKNSRPGSLSKLFHAPFYNVYNDMHVCMGNVKVPVSDGNIIEHMQRWETAFWNSEFTNTVTGAYASVKLNKWWRKGRRGKFNAKQLIPSTQNLKSLCQQTK